jgi:hypothetical protein
VAACLLAWYGAGPLRARGCFTFLQSRLSAVEFLDGSRPRRRFRRCCDIFSKLKAHLRKAAERTILRLLRRIGRVALSARKNAEISFAMPAMLEHDRNPL